MTRRLLVIAATAFAVFGLAPAPAAQALPACRTGFICEWQWWSGPDQTELVGEVVEDTCGGGGYAWGGRSAYVTQSRTPCI